MEWEEVREVYPDKWVVFEAINAYTADSNRIIEDIAVIDVYNESMEAFHRHNELQKQKQSREFYFFHTSRTELDIQDKRWMGLRKI